MSKKETKAHGMFILLIAGSISILPSNYKTKREGRVVTIPTVLAEVAGGRGWLSFHTLLHNPYQDVHKRTLTLCWNLYLF
jgi:hypothetical protein